MKKYIDISGFNLNQSNRGNAALGYGAISFLEEKGLLHEGQQIVSFHSFLNPLKLVNLKIIKEEIWVNGKKWIYKQIPLFYLEKKLVEKYGIILPFTPFGRTVKHVEYEAADYGGDGFSDIYGDRSFYNRMNQTFVLWKANIPLIMLPMTIGPFQIKSNYELAVKIMKYAWKIYVRDDNFVAELDKLGLKYERSKDLSAFMYPEPWNIEIKPNAIGINVSGLAYFNIFYNLKGQFESYPELIERLILFFQQNKCTVYLIPHSYNYQQPDDDGQDDMIACRMVYNQLADKKNIVLVDKDLTSPQVKYVISKMSFFIGTRMHANFAAIYTGVPLFGLAYSYKFAGAFSANGLDGESQTAMINNLSADKIQIVIDKIVAFYHKSIEKILTNEA